MFIPLLFTKRTEVQAKLGADLKGSIRADWTDVEQLFFETIGYLVRYRTRTWNNLFKLLKDELHISTDLNPVF